MSLGLRALSKTIGQTLVRQLLAAAFTVAGTVLVARIYGPEGNGMLAVALLLPGMLATFLNLGVAPANVYHLGAGVFAVRGVVRANMWIFAGTGALGLAAGALALALGSESLFPGVPVGVLMLALSAFPLALLSGYLLSIFQGMQRFGPFNLLSLVQPALFVALVVGIVLVDGGVAGGAGLLAGGVAWLVAAHVASHAVVLLLTAGALWALGRGERQGGKAFRPSALTPPPSPPIIRRTLSYGWKAHLSNILAFVNYKADIFIVNLFLGPAVVGVYVVAVALSEGLWLLSRAVSTVLLPRLSELGRGGAAGADRGAGGGAGEQRGAGEEVRRQLTPLVARWVLLASAVGAAGLAIVAKPVIGLVFGHAFRTALMPLLILLPGIVLTAASRVLANDIAARGRPELNMYISAVVVVANIALNVVLIPALGLAGAAAATSLAYALNLVLRLGVYTRFTGSPWRASLFVTLADFRALRRALRRRLSLQKFDK